MSESTVQAEGSSNAAKSFAERQKERMAKLRKLHTQRNEARTHNHSEVVAEDARNKLPANYESRKRQAEWILADQQARKESASRGEDYDRAQLMNVSALEADQQERRKRKKQPEVQMFADFEAATAKQYNRLIKSMGPKDMEQYEAEKERYGDAFYGGPNVIIHGMQRDKPEAIDRMVQDLEGQIAKREKYSRRRTHNDDADIDYINERNARFNKKLERYYGEHTIEIKQNLERGTAV